MVTYVSANSFYSSSSSEYDVLMLHFGMTGWVSVKGYFSDYIAMENGGDQKARNAKANTKEEEEEEAEPRPPSIYKLSEQQLVEKQPQWPPRFCKFSMVLAGTETQDEETVEMAFTDPRRLGRVWYIPNVSSTAHLKKVEPLTRIGPDYSKPLDRLALDDFSTIMRSKTSQIKSHLLDQSHFAGVGNWVAYVYSFAD